MPDNRIIAITMVRHEAAALIRAVEHAFETGLRDRNPVESLYLDRVVDRLKRATWPEASDGGAGRSANS